MVALQHIAGGLKKEYGHIKEDSPLFRIVEPIPLTPEILEKNGHQSMCETCIGNKDMLSCKINKQNVLRRLQKLSMVGHR